MAEPLPQLLALVDDIPDARILNGRRAMRRAHAIAEGRESGQLQHPGEILRQFQMPDGPFMANELSRMLGVSEETLETIYSGFFAITPERDAKLTAGLNTPELAWYELQLLYDQDQAQQLCEARLDAARSRSVLGNPPLDINDTASTGRHRALQLLGQSRYETLRKKIHGEPQ